ncbi:MAG: hypothetical protein KIB53_11970 [Paraclostridium bifermentans]|uniref:hypothetical protein n=1 Tax=Paraclostridium bifermentans TaxID=1490 RepID=UPI00241E36BB|nr:hypothetical protein [Paraclostridium bifermentans]MBS5954530.1 hypothetical protein [Paraclostridium bifermentans]
MIDMLNNWLGSSTSNFNVFVGITMGIVILSLIVMFYFGHKIGKSDERTYIIHLKIYRVMFVTILLLLSVLINWSDGSYFRQHISLVISLTFLSGAVASVYQYNKDFN